LRYRLSFVAHLVVVSFFSDRAEMKRAFTLVELLVVISIIGVLLALAMPAIQSVRESGRRAQCSNNLHQLALALNNFHSSRGTFPTYNGIYPPGKTTLQTAKPKAVYGSWIVHLLPYIEEKSLSDSINNDVQEFSNSGAKQATADAGNPNGSWSPPPTMTSPAIPATYKNYTGSQQWVSTVNGNGYTVNTLQWVPARTPDPGTGIPAKYDYSKSTWIPPATNNGYVSIWRPTHRRTKFSLLRCPSEMTAPDGLVYNGEWGATNYLANWNALTNRDFAQGYRASTITSAKFHDGTSKTIALAEAYATCEGKGRTAFLAWHKGSDGGFSNFGGVHNFGLTWSTTARQEIDNGTGPVTVNATYGYGNPTTTPYLVFTPQIQPNEAVKGDGGCSSMTVQSPHNVLNIAFADGSNRNVSGEVDRTVWLQLMLPADGQTASNDY
jgi:prepilin-type N-terminal cleavage/methylation domain-containing protein